jgi:hypothetical protein
MSAQSAALLSAAMAATAAEMERVKDAQTVDPRVRAACRARGMSDAAIDAAHAVNRSMRSTSGVDVEAIKRA